MKPAFSLVELILYIALVTIFLSGAISFAWDIIYGRVKSHAQQTVSQNLRLASQRLSYEIRNASAVNTVSGSTLSLANTDSARNPTVFDLSAGRIRVGYGSSGSCPTTTPCFLTSNEATVSGLIFTNLSTSASGTLHVRFSMTVSNASGTRSEYQFSQSSTTSAELRSH